MSVFRVERTKDYTVMSNHHLRERGMSLSAKGMLSLMLSLPDDWDYSMEGLTAICKENKKAVQRCVKELEEFGYIVRTKSRDKDSGKIVWNYDIYESPRPQNHTMVNHTMEYHGMEIDPQLSTYGLSTEKEITDGINTDNIYYRGCKQPMKFTPPSLEEVIAYCEERQNSIDAEKFIPTMSQLAGSTELRTLPTGKPA